MRTIVSLLFVITSFTFCNTAIARAQETITPDLSPKTKLEAFQARTNVVIVKGYSRIGSATGEEGSSVRVETIELRDASANSKTYGIAVEVRDAQKPERSNISMVDYDEIDSLLKGLDYLGKVDSSVTQLRSFEADYRTRGDLVFSAFSGRGSAVTISVSSGVIRPVTSFFRLEDLRAIAGLIIEAKKQLVAIQ